MKCVCRNKRDSTIVKKKTKEVIRGIGYIMRMGEGEKSCLADCKTSFLLKVGKSILIDAVCLEFFDNFRRWCNIY